MPPWTIIVRLIIIYGHKNAENQKYGKNYYRGTFEFIPICSCLIVKRLVVSKMVHEISHGTGNPSIKRK